MLGSYTAGGVKGAEEDLEDDPKEDNNRNREDALDDRGLEEGFNRDLEDYFKEGLEDEGGLIL